VTDSGSQSHIATDSQSVGLSWCRTPSGAYDQNLFIPFSFKTVTVLSMWAPSLTRGQSQCDSDTDMELGVKVVCSTEGVRIVCWAVGCSHNVLHLYKIIIFITIF
jgi:hypothetical protein